ncbi:MAG: hypothetical protein EXR95_07485 [Gemmatimonadetes bacterium]|nr:hypothetical protein [Gemmatimonadota bacterium]
MPPLRRFELALRGATALATAVAAAALLWPARAPMVEIAPAGLESPPAAAAAPRADPALSRGIADANIFSATRRAPRERYRPDAAQATGEGMAGDGPSAAAGGGGVPHLYGIVPDASGAAALLRLDPGAPGALLYREGDRGGMYRVDSIGEQSVVLSGPSGRLELRLPRPQEPIR